MFEDIIRMFKEKDGFVSGEEMSRRLGITRAAIWKKIRALREKGYVIEGSTAKGYRLIKTPEFSVEELRALINPSRPPLKLRGGEGGVMSMERIFGKEIIFHESIDSTNTLAMELAEKGVSHGTVIIADRQLKGKGRLGRTWFSPPKGNIYMSVIVRPEIEPKDATLLTIMSAISCARAIRNSTGLEVKIKWPNDLMVSDLPVAWQTGRKLGGILTEMKSDQDRIVFAVIGIGINVNARLDMFPDDICAAAASVMEELREKGYSQEISRTLIIAAILNEL